MRCNFCRATLEKKWKFCPYCGESVIRDSDNFEGMPLELKRMFKAVFPNLNIKINGDDVFCGQTKTKQIKKPMEKPADKIIERSVNDIIEPETKIYENPGYVKIIAKLPGVQKVSNIKIRKFSESLEIRAYFKDKMYFKVVPIFENSKIIENKFTNEMLKLVLTNKE